ncbi:ferric reductase-like transmembrane domain-containing protein [Aestuariibacter sp. AA17]|uniref:Ferric reductase-like transmembrane domain-containing protein n=1 Tax=Fluctibacter corallii TaxID=2984329 RepID=A0ABT3ABP3_9ALTE|nr:ferric reductase-like transmembrane domain-containing protein [Aestuariibacter sp. AA17]MCV2885706.1 ferric reductase-like transmembrane domain-containing protein [Aestuariibacter sp. AA17]
MRDSIQFIKRQQPIIKRLLLIIAMLLAIYAVFPALIPSANSFETIMYRSGTYALIFLLLSLAITPLRRWLSICFTYLHAPYGKRLADWNFLIQYRRRIGLISALFALIHCIAYLHMEVVWIVDEAIEDALRRSFIWIGWLSITVYVVLTITSITAIQKKLKRTWRQIHRSVYGLLVLVLLHFFLAEKAGDTAYLPYVIIGGLLLIHRIVFAIVDRHNQRYDDGLEATR